MDRNLTWPMRWQMTFVALRKESVDRNIRNRLDYEVLSKSLSARRAWIEMWYRSESWTAIKSLSARRAWIEIIGEADN